MAVNRVDFGGNTLIDLTGDTLDSAEQLLKGIIAHAKDGSVITGLLEAGGSENQLVYGTYTPASDQTAAYGGSFSAEFGFVPDVFVMCQSTAVLGPTKNSAAIIISRPYAYGGAVNPSFFRSIVSAPTDTSQIGTSNHRYYVANNMMKETTVAFFGPSGSLLVGGVEYFWIAAKFT